MPPVRKSTRAKQKSRKDEKPMLSSSEDPQESIRKLQPKLRMVANSSVKVGVLRAERSSSIVVKNDDLAREYGTRPGGELDSQSFKMLPRSVKRGKQRKIPNNIYVNVFIETSDSSDAMKVERFAGETTRRGNLVSATVPLAKLSEIAQGPTVNHISLGEPLAAPTPEVTVRSPAKPPERKFGDSRKHKNGKGIIIGIIDVQGFDFSH